MDEIGAEVRGVGWNIKKARFMCNVQKNVFLYSFLYANNFPRFVQQNGTWWTLTIQNETFFFFSFLLYNKFSMDMQNLWNCVGGKSLTIKLIN